MSGRLDPETIATVQTLRNNGYSYSEIQSKTGLSAGSVANALKGGKKTSKTLQALTQAPVSDAAQEPTEVLTHDNIRHILSEQIEFLSAQAKACRATGDEQGLSRASRNLAQTSALLAKLTPQPEAEQQDGIYVTKESLSAAALACKEKLREKLRKALESNAKPL